MSIAVKLGYECCLDMDTSVLDMDSSLGNSHLSGEIEPSESLFELTS